MKLFSRCALVVKWIYSSIFKIWKCDSSQNWVSPFSRWFMSFHGKSSLVLQLSFLIDDTVVAQKKETISKTFFAQKNIRLTPQHVWSPPLTKSYFYLLWPGLWPGQSIKSPFLLLSQLGWGRKEQIVGLLLSMTFAFGVAKSRLYQE